MLPSTIKNFAADARTTLDQWARYKRKTGKLPWLSVVVHASNWTIVTLGIAFLIWLADQHHLSRGQFALLLVALGIPYAVLWYRIKSVVKLRQLRRRRLAKN